MTKNTDSSAARTSGHAYDPVLDSLKEGKIILPSVARDMANPAWDDAATRILIVRLSPWRDVDISTPHLVLFDEIRSSLAEAYLDFAFMPTAADRKALSSRDLPWFFGRASGRSPQDFDIIMISNAFALELVNLPYLFATAGMPMSAASRALLDSQPIVIAGGSNASAMGSIVLEEPLGKLPARDAFVDGIFFGEGELSIGKLASALSGKGPGRRNAASRGARLAEAGNIAGFWPCLIAEGAKKALAPGRPHSVTKPLILNGSGASSVRLTITSGCPGYCSFCLEGWDRRPYREADFDRLLQDARRLRRESGAEDLEIYSFNFNTHSRIFDLIFELNRIFRRVSFMSQRLDILAETKGLMETEMAGGKRSYTLGIEGISEAMRAFYRKGLTAGHMESCFEKTIRSGVKELKLFFIIGGMETVADIAEFGLLMERVKRRKDAQSPSTRILVSAGFLVRLPFTPLQYAPLEYDRDKLVRLGHLLREACENAGIEFRLASNVDECFVDQTLSLAGAAAYQWLTRVPSMGTVYDISLGEGAWKSLRHAVLGQDADPAYLAEKPPEYRPPLAFLEDGQGFGLLHDHYLEAKALKDRPGCLGKECTACGVCGDGDEIEAMSGHELTVPPIIRHVEKIEALLAAKARFAPAFAMLDYPPGIAGSHSAYRMSWLLRDMSARIAGAENVVFEAKELLFHGNTPFGELFAEGESWHGRSAVALYGPDAKRTAQLVSRLSGMSLLEAEPHPSALAVEITLPEGHVDAVRKVFGESCENQKLAFTAKKEDGGWSYEFSASSRGRRVFSEARLRETEGATLLSLTLGEKARLSPLLDEIAASSGFRPGVSITGWN